MERDTDSLARSDFDIAIVGMAARFPGARNVDEFWRNLADGIESITQLSDEVMLRAGIPRSVFENPRYVKAAPLLENPGLFDAGFFGYSPAEARIIDPQHRILLELAHEALENAGCDPDRYPGRIGVFAGAAMNTYFMHAGFGERFAEDYIPTLIANDKDFLSTRLSYKLNLKGPSITVQTACSTSLVAVHLARQSLLAHETDVAIVGAVSVRVPNEAGYLCDGGGIVSQDARVRAFDAKANGTVFGSGGGVLLLKRRSDAIADRDTIRAIIKGSAVNNDGSEKAGYTAPSVNGQAEVLVEALGVADVGAENITYVEAHGSGTPVGDPIEIAALTKAFRVFTPRSGYCAIGSVKTNVGHLDVAAGIAGTIKTVLALERGQLPPSLNYNEPNPAIDFKTTPFFVNKTLASWSADKPRRAAVISTGMGGTNASLILEEASPTRALAVSKMPHLLVLSAKTSTALDTATIYLRDRLRAKSDLAMDDVAHTLQSGRREFAYRRALVCSGREDAIAALGEKNARRINTKCVADTTRRPIVFLFPGVGDQYVGMGRELYDKCRVFRSEIDRCALIVERYLNVDIREVLYPKSFTEDRATVGNHIDLKRMLGAKAATPEITRLNQTIFVQPALFAVEFALARFWQSIGIQPDAIVGHSMGEYVAACLADVLSLEDAVRLIVRRAKLVSELPQGAMLAVVVSEQELRPWLSNGLCISLINSSKLCVVAGPAARIAAFEKILDTKGIIHRRVQNGHAFHSPMISPVVPSFLEEVRAVCLREPKIPYISNVTGKWIDGHCATEPDYWGRHAVETARFNEALNELNRFHNPILLEVGPGRTLGILAAEQLGQNALTIISSLRHDYENYSDTEFLLKAVGEIWTAGARVEWSMIPRGKPGRKIPLPTYPFEKQNHWVEPNRVPTDVGTPIPTRSEMSEWFYVPSWKRELPKFAEPSDLENRGRHNWLIFCDESGASARIVSHLRAGRQNIITVRPGERFQGPGNEDYVLDPARSDDYEMLCRQLRSANWIPDHVIHAWNLDDSTSSRCDSFQQAQEAGFYSLTFLARSLTKHNLGRNFDLFVLSNQVQDVYGNEKGRVASSTLLASIMVIRQEYPEVRTKNIDLDSTFTSAADNSLVQHVIGEFFNESLFVAYRNGKRWVQIYDRIALDTAGLNESRLREGGVYLITGGLGKIGCEISAYLACNYHAKLILLGRSKIPDREAWDRWIKCRRSDDPVRNKLETLKEIERLGGKVSYFSADVSDYDSVRRVIDAGCRKFGNLNGVIHAAGTVGSAGYCELKDLDGTTCESHFDAKVRGLQSLEAALEDKMLDFCLLLSSLSSILGGIGQAAYSASNIYMDAFARRHNRTHSRAQWLSVNWDVWRIGDEQRFGTPGLGKTLIGLGMSAEEALEALELALRFRTVSQLAVSTGDLNARIDQWLNFEAPPKLAAVAATQVVSAKTSPDFENEIERLVAEAWREALGITEVNRHDNFVDLGGHSLLAIRIVANLRKVFQIE